MAKLSSERKNYVVTVEFQRADGTPGRVDGPPAWAIDDPGIATVHDVAEDGLSALITPADLLDEAFAVTVLTLTADVDLGEGVKELVVREALEIQAGEVTGATFVFGEGEPKAEV